MKVTLLEKSDYVKVNKPIATKLFSVFLIEVADNKRSSVLRNPCGSLSRAEIAFSLVTCYVGFLTRLKIYNFFTLGSSNKHLPRRLRSLTLM